MSLSAFRGIFTPLVTPVDATGTLDLASMERLVDFQLQQGVHGLWVMGTTGEFAAFDADERASATRTVVERVAGRVPVIANVSDAATRLALRHAQRARESGADAIAATPPYYYPHSQAELLDHYAAIRSSVDLPLLIYNIPQTVRVNVGLETACRLAEDGTVVGIKDSQNDLEWFRELTLRLGEREFRAFAGTRHLIDAAVLAGAVGAIPSIANAYPHLCVRTYEAAARGDFATARAAQTEIVAIESRVPAGQGSRNAAVIGMLKRQLSARGILDSHAVTAPLLVD